MSSLASVKALHDMDTYHCPHCKVFELGYERSDRSSRLSAAVLERRKPEFVEKLRLAGLFLSSDIFVRSDRDIGEIFATVCCPKGHTFDVGMSELGKLLSNKWLADRSTVPYTCDRCCYPTGTPHERKGTLFHRLVFLRKDYPTARYIGGFDSTGMAMEEYNCGRQFLSTGEPHPNFFLRYRSISDTNKTVVLRSRCYVCAVSNGNALPFSAKTLDMIRGRMRLINEALADHGGKLLVPTAKLAPAEKLIAERYISTTKTKIVFFCGDPNHPPQITTSDNFFNMNKGGYCKSCLRSINIETVKAVMSSKVSLSDSNSASDV